MLVKVAYYASGSARFLPKLCSNYARFSKSNSRGISTQLKSDRKIGVEPTVNSNLSFLVAEIFVFLNYSKIVLLRQENIRIMLAVLLLEKGQKLCSIPQIMPKKYASTIGKSLPVTPVTPICFFPFLGCGGLGLGKTRHSGPTVAPFLSHSPICLC